MLTKFWKSLFPDWQLTGSTGWKVLKVQKAFSKIQLVHEQYDFNSGKRRWIVRYARQPRFISQRLLPGRVYQEVHHTSPSGWPSFKWELISNDS